jgi:3-isopropylmalate dehydratase small subunit
MERFTRLKALSAPLPQANIDTDIIYPARFLLITAKTGLGRYAFYEWRFGPDGSERPDFVLNDARFKSAEILIAGDNFGCGSSREQAPWALRDLGVRAIISTSFGEIFYANCFKNGILPVRVAKRDHDRLLAEAETARPIEIDLEHLQVRLADGGPIAFSVERWRRAAMLDGSDEIAVILREDGGAIDAFEHRQRNLRPWLYQGE